MHVIKFNGPKEVEGTYGTFANCRGQGRVTLRFESTDKGKPLEIMCTLSDDAFPPDLKLAALEGIEHYSQESGLPLDGVLISIVGAAVHPVDRSPMLFKLAAIDAMKQACDWALKLE